HDSARSLYICRTCFTLCRRPRSLGSRAIAPSTQSISSSKVTGLDDIRQDSAARTPPGQPPRRQRSGALELTPFFQCRTLRRRSGDAGVGGTIAAVRFTLGGADPTIG